MQVENLIKVEYRGELVLSSKQIANHYECPVQNIRHNFSDNKDKFIEGVHYFKLEGETLREFKAYFAKLAAQKIRADGVKNFHSAELPCAKSASAVVLWTVRGAARHAKMIGTEKAWEMFNLLEDNYFGQIDRAEIEEPAESESPLDFKNIAPAPPEKLPPLLELLKLISDNQIRDKIVIRLVERSLGEKLF